MSFINSIIKAFVGDKSEKDVKALQPYLLKNQDFESSLIALTHDELRARTAFKENKNESRGNRC
jgi:preprotein translocase subunit SecA